MSVRDHDSQGLTPPIPYAGDHPPNLNRDSSNEPVVVTSSSDPGTRGEDSLPSAATLNPHPRRTPPPGARDQAARATWRQRLVGWLAMLWILILDASPPWLVSMAIHISIFLFLALLFHSTPDIRAFDLTAVFSDEKGEQLDEPILDLETIAMVPVNDRLVTPLELPPVEMPLASAPQVPPSLHGVHASSNFDAPVAAVSLSGRDPGMKEALLKAYGGTATTEHAVARALDWLKRRQQPRGSWSLKGPYKQASVYDADNQEAATGMALLAFQGAGHTHVRGDYREEVKKGWDFLLSRQAADGNFFRSGEENQPLYTQAICAIALCELYALTRDATLHDPAQRATDYLVAAQDELGGWRYEVAYDSDTSVTGWVVLAMKSAQMAGLIVPSRTFERVHNYLDLATTDEGSHYGYKPGHADTPAMTAEALLCRQYLGWKRDDPRLERGVKSLLKNQVVWREPNVYYWYYATQVMHHMEGDDWHEWNKSMRDRIPKKQQQTGPERGSWPPPAKDRWSTLSGRLFTTCMCTYMLEVYYRHLPIYAPMFRFRM